ncbi:hypothetical protein BDD12DRAFT_871595 [Trichophaea hybrida]|nr:hypothetical protein BDD12DRAFT_871595 [Trichophaea hybrida]
MKSNLVFIEKVARRADSRTSWARPPGGDDALDVPVKRSGNARKEELKTPPVGSINKTLSKSTPSSRSGTKRKSIRDEVRSQPPNTPVVPSSGTKRKSIQDEVRSPLTNTPAVPMASSSSLLNAPPSSAPRDPKPRMHFAAAKQCAIPSDAHA